MNHVPLPRRVFAKHHSGPRALMEIRDDLSWISMSHYSFQTRFEEREMLGLSEKKFCY